MEHIFHFLKEEKFKIYVTALSDNSVYLEDLKPNKKCALVLGNEGQGISKEVFDISTHKIHIPMSKKMESLNVGVAGSIIMSKIFISSK